MVWFKVDDGFYSSRKVLSIPRAQRLAAVGLWTLAGNWSGRELTDGVVPSYALAELGATPRLRQALIEARLWLDRDVTEPRPRLDRGLGDIEFHDWARWQPTRAEVEAAREKERIRKAEWRLSRGDKGGTDGGTPAGRGAESRGVSGYPDPTRPDPTLTTTSNEVVEARKRATRIPADWQPSPELLAWAVSTVPAIDVLRETPNFIDYWTSAPGARGVKADWDATWRTWMRRQLSVPIGRRLTRTEENLQVVAEYANRDRLAIEEPSIAQSTGSES